MPDNTKVQQLIEYYQQKKYEAHSHLVVDKNGKLTLNDKGLPLIEVYASGVIEKADDEEGSITHYISTPRIDAVDDVMNPFGCDDAVLQKNKAVFYNHRYSGPRDLPIGSNLWLKKQKDGVLCKTKYAIGVTKDDFAGDVYRLAKAGFLNSYSIGWRPEAWDILQIKDLLALIATKPASKQFEIPNVKDFAPDYRVMYHDSWTTHEYSQVGVACNEDAVRKQLEKAFEDGLVKSDFGKTYFGGMLNERVKLGEVSTEGFDKLMEELGSLKVSNEGLRQSQETLVESISDISKKFDGLTLLVTGVSEKQDQCLTLLDETETKGEEEAPPTPEKVEEQSVETVGDKTTSFDASKLFEQIATGAVSGVTGK